MASLIWWRWWNTNDGFHSCRDVVNHGRNRCRYFFLQSGRHSYTFYSLFYYSNYLFQRHDIPTYALTTKLIATKLKKKNKFHGCYSKTTKIIVSECSKIRGKIGYIIIFNFYCGISVIIISLCSCIKSSVSIKAIMKIDNALTNETFSSSLPDVQIQHKI